MVFTTLRVRGADFPVDAFLRERRLQVSAVWRKGEPMRGGHVFEDSGFNISLPDAESWAMALPAVRAFLESERTLLEHLHALALQSVLDVGVSVGEERSYAPSLEFPHDVLAQLAAHGVSLCVSAYPTSDES
jgi:hypothetical protein